MAAILVLRSYTMVGIHFFIVSHEALHENTLGTLAH